MYNECNLFYCFDAYTAFMRGGILKIR